MFDSPVAMLSISTTVSLQKMHNRSLNILSRLQSRQDDILSLLWDFHTSECRDPSDRIRALYGLTYLGPKILDRVDRDAHADWPLLCQSLTMESIRKDQCPALLRHLFAFGPLAQLYPDLHPYTPNWSSTRQVQSYLQIAASEQEFPHTLDDRLLRSPQGDVFEALVVQGYHVLKSACIMPNGSAIDVLVPFVRVLDHDNPVNNFNTIGSRAADVLVRPAFGDRPRLRCLNVGRLQDGKYV